MHPGELRLLYGFIEQVGSEFAVSQLCKIFYVSRSAYYEWKAGQTYQPAQQQQAQQAKVEKAFWPHSRRYGSSRLVTELLEMDLEIGRKKVRRFMRIQGFDPYDNAFAESFFSRFTNDQRPSPLHSHNLRARCRVA